MNQSKVIGKGDDSAKLFIQRSLNGAKTHGFDHDSVYYVQGKYYLFEYLKCDSTAMTPYTSNPKFYPYNWRKFYSLWQTAQKLEAYLLLVNYSDRSADRDLVKVMYVTDFDYEALDCYLAQLEADPYYKWHCEYLIMEEYRLTFSQYAAYLRRINELATLPKDEKRQLPERILSYLNGDPAAGHASVSHPILPN